MKSKMGIDKEILIRQIENDEFESVEQKKKLSIPIWFIFDNRKVTKEIRIVEKNCLYPFIENSPVLFFPLLLWRVDSLLFHR